MHHARVERLIPRLTARQLAEKIATGEDPFIIDLRPHGDQEDIPGIPGSITLSLDEVLAKRHDLPYDRDVVLYCACPRDATSVQAAWRLREAGFTRVWPLAGGVEAWYTMLRESGQAARVSYIHTLPA